SRATAVRRRCDLVVLAGWFRIGNFRSEVSSHDDHPAFPNPVRLATIVLCSLPIRLVVWTKRSRGDSTHDDAERKDNGRSDEDSGASIGLVSRSERTSQRSIFMAYPCSGGLTFVLESHRTVSLAR